MSSAVDFAPVAATLRRELEAYFGRRAPDRTALSLAKTVATNSDLVERRGRPLVAMLSGAGMTSLEEIRLLDLGCGFGALAAYFAAQGARVKGIDITPSRFCVGRAAAAEHDLAVELAEGRMESLAAPAEHFDVAVMNNTLCYLIDPAARRAALAGVAQALRPGGLLLIRELNRWHPLDQFTNFPLLPALKPEYASRMAQFFRKTRPNVRIVSPPALARELRDAGFHEVRQLSDRPTTPVRLTRNVARYQHIVARR